jgi:predicted N-formylglutamate amidohydrolase
MTSVRRFEPSHEVISVSDKSKPLHWSILLTCEHGSNSLPEGWEWGENDEKHDLKNTHWAIDLGSRAFLNDLFQTLLESNQNLAVSNNFPSDPKGVIQAVCARSSRIFIDCNRPNDHPGLFRVQYEGINVDLNSNLTETQKSLRSQLVYKPYHEAISQIHHQHEPKMVLSIHSFTPVLDGKPRDMEFGVLFDDDGPLGHVVR